MIPIFVSIPVYSRSGPLAGLAVGGAGALVLGAMIRDLIVLRPISSEKREINLRKSDYESLVRENT